MLEHLLALAGAFALMGGCETWAWSRTCKASESVYRPERSVAAFTAVALLNDLSSRLVHSLIPGFALGLLFLAAGILYLTRTGKLSRPRLQDGDTFRGLTVLTVAVVFTAPLLAQSNSFRLPDIFDFPKHIVAIVAAATGSWPAPNPFFPTEAFAYNLLYYNPWAAIFALIPAPGIAPTLAALATLWSVWLVIGLVRRVTEVCGFPGPERRFSVLAATFLGGFYPLLSATDVPLGFSDAMNRGASVWAEDPFANFVYIPQHLFALTTILAAFVWVVSQDLDRLWQWGAPVGLLVGSVLSSFIVAPFALGASGLLLVGTAVHRHFTGRGHLLPGFIAFITVLLMTAPILLQVNGWRGDSDGIRLGFLPGTSGWLHAVFAMGIVPWLAAWGGMRMLRSINLASFLLLGLLTGAFLFLQLLHFPDSEIKAFTLIRFLVCPLAGVGMVAIWNGMSGSVRRPVLQSLALGALAGSVGFGLLLPIYFIGTGFRPREEAEQFVLKHLQELSPTASVWIHEPNQELAALTGRPLYMPFADFRADAYLPGPARPAAAAAFLDHSVHSIEDLLQGFPFPIDQVVRVEPFVPNQWWSFHFNRDFNAGRYSVWSIAPDYQLGEQFDLLTTTWRPWRVPEIGVHFDSVHHEISTPEPVDEAFVVTKPLPAGRYVLELAVEGTVSPDGPVGAHVSLHGLRKIISLPPGDYTPGSRIFGLLDLPESPEPIQFAFGFGGWGKGAGQLRFVTATLHKLERKP